MIRYALRCNGGHEFEGWFSASADYDAQSDRGLVACPVCDTRAVSKQVMSPAVSSATRARSVEASTHGPSQIRDMMMRGRRHVETHFDFVGDHFATEARAIHEGKAEERGIYGEASAAEVKALVADGVPIAPLPPEPPQKTRVN